VHALTLDCTINLKPATQTRSQTVVSHDLKFPTSNQHLDTRLDVGLTLIRRLRFQTRVVQSAVSDLPNGDSRSRIARCSLMSMPRIWALFVSLHFLFVSLHFLFASLHFSLCDTWNISLCDVTCCYCCYIAHYPVLILLLL